MADGMKQEWYGHNFIGCADMPYFFFVKFWLLFSGQPFMIAIKNKLKISCSQIRRQKNKKMKNEGQILRLKYKHRGLQTNKFYLI